MTAANPFAQSPASKTPFRLPYPPERHPDDLTSFDHLSATGSVHHLIQHFGNPDTTLVAGERYMVVRPTRRLAGSRYPDLLVALGVDPALYKASNGYIIEDQGKPPDFVLEIASLHTGHIDVGAKRDDYAALAIPEYWRFDETGEFHGTRLGGDRLVAREYAPIPIDELEDGVLQGYSDVLNLHLRWEHGQLGWYDPATGRHIATFEEERAARIQAETRAIDAETRVQQLEAELRRLRDG